MYNLKLDFIYLAQQLQIPKREIFVSVFLIQFQDHPTVDVCPMFAFHSTSCPALSQESKINSSVLTMIVAAAHNEMLVTAVET